MIQYDSLLKNRILFNSIKENRDRNAGWCKGCILDSWSGSGSSNLSSALWIIKVIYIRPI